MTVGVYRKITGTCVFQMLVKQFVWLLDRFFLTRPQSRKVMPSEWCSGKAKQNFFLTVGFFFFSLFSCSLRGSVNLGMLVGGERKCNLSRELTRSDNSRRQFLIQHRDVWG